MEKGLLRITGMETSAKGLLPHELQSGAQAYRKEAFGMDTLADRLNRIIKEQGISKADFARLLGISENYVYILTGNSRSNSRLSPPLAKLIALGFGYDVDWIMNGKE